MHYILISSFASIFFIGTSFSMAGGSLRQLAASFIADHTELHGPLKRKVPALIAQTVGYEFCKKHLKESWMFVADDRLLYGPHGEYPCETGDKIRGVSFLGTSHKAVSVSAKGIIHWWETIPFPHCIQKITTDYTEVTGFSVSSNGELTAIVGSGKVSLWLNEEYREIPLEGVVHDEPIHSVFCTSTRLMVGGSLGKIWIWDIENIRTKKATCLATMIHKRLPERLAELNKVHALYVCPDQSLCFSVLHKNIKVWDMNTFSLKTEFEIKCPSLISKVHFRECGWDAQTKRSTDVEILSCFTDGTLIINRVSGGEPRRIKVTEELLASCIPSADGKFLLTGSRTNTVSIWERLETADSLAYQPLQKFFGKNVITQLAFRKDQTAALIGNNAGELRFWTINDQLTLDQAQKALGLAESSSESEEEINI